jgi:hypothetical protein
MSWKKKNTSAGGGLEGNMSSGCRFSYSSTSSHQFMTDGFFLNGERGKTVSGLGVER